MSDNQQGSTPGTDLTTGLPLDRDVLERDDDLQRRVDAGELTQEQADELLQAAERRHAAEVGPDEDTSAGGITSESGFGSGVGLGDNQSHRRSEGQRRPGE